MVSTWEKVDRFSKGIFKPFQPTAKNAMKHTSWPNPFRNAIKNIDVLACEDRWQAMVEMYFVGFGNWFWSSFVPSPVELTRKFVAGSYKCGFYLLPETASPLDIIWRDGRTSRALMEIASPITTGLFYMWAGETAFSFLNTWSSIIHAQQMCDVQGNEVLLSNGSAPFGGGTYHLIGEAALYNVLYDPLNRYPELGSGPADHFDNSATGVAVGQIVMAASKIDNFTIWVYGGVDGTKQHLGTVMPGQVASFNVYFSGNVQAEQAITVRFEGDVTGETILPNVIEVNRFTCSFGGPDEPNKFNHLYDYNPKDNMCGKLYEQIKAVSLG